MAPTVAVAELGPDGRYLATILPAHGGKHKLTVNIQWRDRLYQSNVDVDVGG